MDRSALHVFIRGCLVTMHAFLKKASRRNHRFKSNYTFE